MQTSSPNLSLTEELILLVLDPESGKLGKKDKLAWQACLSGSLLLELSLQGRIDTDLTRITLVDATPTSFPAADFFLERMTAESDLSLRKWVYEGYRFADQIEDMALDALVEKDIIRAEHKRYLGLVEARRFPSMDRTAEREVKRRLMDVLFRDGIPEARDIALLSLCDACHLFSNILTAAEVENCSERVRKFARTELVSVSVCAVIGEVYLEMSRHMH